MARKFRMVYVTTTVQVVSDEGLAFSEVCRLVDEALHSINKEDGQAIWVRKIHSMELGSLCDVPEAADPLAPQRSSAGEEE